MQIFKMSQVWEVEIKTGFRLSPRQETQCQKQTSVHKVMTISYVFRLWFSIEETFMAGKKIREHNIFKLLLEACRQGLFLNCFPFYPQYPGKTALHIVGTEQMFVDWMKKNYVKKPGDFLIQRYLNWFFISCVLKRKKIQIVHIYTLRLKFICFGVRIKYLHFEKASLSFSSFFFFSPYQLYPDYYLFNIFFKWICFLVNEINFVRELYI